MKIRRREIPVEIPTASMADVAFLLIIFFLVASFYSVTRGIQFSLPKHDEAALTAEPEAAVLIEIASRQLAHGRQPQHGACGSQGLHRPQAAAEPDEVRHPADICSKRPIRP